MIYGVYLADNGKVTKQIGYHSDTSDSYWISIIYRMGDAKEKRNKKESV